MCLQWPKNRVGLQAPLHTANRRAGAKRVRGGGRKSPSGAKIAFPGCVHAHSGSFWGGHLKYYINWRTKITRFWLVEFPCTQIFFFFKKNFPPKLTLLVRHHRKNDRDTNSSQIRFLSQLSDRNTKSFSSHRTFCMVRGIRVNFNELAHCRNDICPPNLVPLSEKFLPRSQRYARSRREFEKNFFSNFQDL